MIQDWVLFVMIGILIAIDVAYLIIVTAVPASRLQLRDVEVPSNVCQLFYTHVTCTVYTVEPFPKGRPNVRTCLCVGPKSGHFKLSQGCPQ